MKPPLRVLLVNNDAEFAPYLEDLVGSVPGVDLVGRVDQYDGTPDSSPDAPEVVIVALDGDPERRLDQMQAIARGASPPVIVAATEARDAELLVRAFRAGARECLLLPPSAQEVERVLTGLAVRRRELTVSLPQRARTITVVGATGGIGCSSIALNLAVALKRAGSVEIALADLDLISGVIAPGLDLYPETSLAQLAQNIERLDVALLRRAMVRHEPSGLMVLPGLDAIHEVDAIDPAAVATLLERLKESFGAVVIDTSKGLHATDLAGMRAADTILLVVQLDVLSLRSGLRLLNLLRGLDGLGEKVQVVINRVGSGAFDVSPRKVEETLELPVSWQVPNAFRAFHAARSRGEPLRADNGGAPALRAFDDMARGLLPAAVTAGTSVPTDSGGRAAAWWAPRGRRRSAAAAS